MKDQSIIIVGAGFGGLSAGIYAQMNGYNTRIFEMHNLPGGLCTSWKRKGYTIDGCIHWLVGSSPQSWMHRYWEQVGIVPGREFVYFDEYMRHEGKDGRILTLYSNVDKLEQHLLEFSPQDAEAIREFVGGVRLCMAFDMPSASAPLFHRILKGLKFALVFALKYRSLQKFLKTTTADFVLKFKDPMIREALREMWVPEFSMFFILFTFAWLHNKNAAYPIGGSLPMSQAMARRYLELGGTIDYGKRVEKIIVEGDRAVGVRLADGSEHRAERIVSAADGHTTIFSMLDGRYADAKTREPYEKWPTFPSILLVAFGVNRLFNDEPKTVFGISFPLREPVEIADSTQKRLWVHVYNHDSTLAPAGKTVVEVLLPTNYDYWKELARDQAVYGEKKDKVARIILEMLEQRFPGISGQVEMMDVATPLTFERFTGNWKGNFEGWLITPENASTIMRPMSQTLPGLSDFYMCGQWVQPGGGLPSGVMSGERLVKSLCKQDGKRFRLQK
ncbi:MAG: NAD(P)/FAD-dependent oxidoreductase [Kiritimatiellae bacterium]|nr:NAD(P)/FAD-dependent oxidoreductase [Kiritimatiellia bacterium]MDD5522777.1 NAD(P)/FAD-dependent oxidoreductase [Kiritimatiellia bacterium]